ncbi:MAG: sigma-70 family RNA polymerase sigma factor [Akkermansia sp.]|nr:sigma-70 family RNA polymerase sigma factor [Akkermansiaceae bacterium]MBQ3143909.1 sigma-70 family RNA polymerase sigma factor [Akkermansia sp.]
MAESPENLWLAELWLEHRERIARLLVLRMPAVLQRRVGIDDLLQETYLACGKRLEFLKAEPEVPVYAKLRRLALQTLADMERRHLGAGKRDAMREYAPEDASMMDAWAQFADSISSPRSHMERVERQQQIRLLLTQLSPADREILELRHFEELSNGECAAVLGIEVKAASIRYVRAVKRFRELIEKVYPYMQH